MDTKYLTEQGRLYLTTLCEEIPNRAVGSSGNRAATRFLKSKFRTLGWETITQSFDAIDWETDGASLVCDGHTFEVMASPYSLGIAAEAELVHVSDLKTLEQTEIAEKIMLLHGTIASEQLMPKNFPFYNPESHQHIISLLEQGEPTAIITATGRNAALAGGVYPFPMLEDGDFDIPSVYMKEEDGENLLEYAGKVISLDSKAKRIRGTGYNVIGRKGQNESRRIVVTAHIDAKKGTPGAIDNATGIVVLLHLAKLLENYSGRPAIELVAFNGEDYYSAPGQVLYVKENQNRFGDILLNINIDGAGYFEGPSAFSFFNLPEDVATIARQVVSDSDGIIEGKQWGQGDHSIFTQQGCPAIAVTSQWFLENMESQNITHTARDNLSIVDPGKVAQLSQALYSLVTSVAGES